MALDIARGEIVGIAGHVGAGKSTLALAAAGLLGRSVPATIDATIVHPLGGRPPAAFVFANPSTQLTELGETVEEEVAVGPENQALASPAIRARVDDALAQANASALALRLPRELSGGELQRVALASALALDAPLLVLDEPTAQLDPEAAAQFAHALRALRDGGVAVLIVEQNLELLASLADRVLVLADGAVLATGAPRDVLGRDPPLDARLGALRTNHVPPAPRTRAEHVPLVTIERLSAGYGDREVLRELSLAIGAGEVSPGSAETGRERARSRRTIMGLVEARSGRIRVGERDISAAPRARAGAVGRPGVSGPASPALFAYRARGSHVRSPHPRRLARRRHSRRRGKRSRWSACRRAKASIPAISRRSCSGGWRSHRRSPHDRNF